MAVSPVVLMPSPVDKAKTQLKLSTNGQSDNGTSKSSMHTTGAGADVAEQMNDEEKHKYVKGAYHL